MHTLLISKDTCRHIPENSFSFFYGSHMSKLAKKNLCPETTFSFFLSSSRHNSHHHGGRILQSVIIITAGFISVTAKFGAWCLPFKLSAAILTHLNHNSTLSRHHPESFIPPALSVIILYLSTTLTQIFIPPDII